MAGSAGVSRSDGESSDGTWSDVDRKLARSGSRVRRSLCCVGFSVNGMQLDIQELGGDAR